MIKKDEKYISTSEAAEILGLSRVAVFKRIKKGEISARKIGRNYVIEKESLSPALKEDVSEADKKFVSDTTGRVVEEYGKTLELLGKE